MDKDTRANLLHIISQTTEPKPNKRVLPQDLYNIIKDV